MRALNLEVWSRRLKAGIGPCEMRAGNWIHLSKIRVTRDLCINSFNEDRKS